MAQLLILAAACIPVLYLSSFLHELGHALLGWAAGYRVTSFGLGVARPFCVCKWGATRVYLCRRSPLQGITFSFFPDLFPGRMQAVAMLAGGVLANAFLALLATGLWKCTSWGGHLWLMAAIVNASFAVTNLFPFTVRIGTFSLRSDGALILSTLLQGAISTPAPLVIRTTAGLRPLWEAIADTTILRIHLLTAAMAWSHLGDREEAQRLYDEAQLLPADERLLSLLAYTELMRGAHLSSAGKLDAAEEAYTAAAKGYAALSNEAGIILTRIGQAEVLGARGNAPAAALSLPNLASHPLVARQPALRTAVLEAQLSVEAALPASQDLRQLEIEYKNAGRRYPSMTLGLPIYRQLAQHYEKLNDWPRAESMYREALAGAQRLYAQFTDPEDQKRFRQAQGNLLAAAADLLRRLGKEEEASQVDSLLPTPEERRQREAQAQTYRNRRLIHWGLLLLGSDLLFVLGAVTLVLALRPARPVPVFVAFMIVMAALMVVCLALAAIVAPLLYLLGRRSKPLRLGTGVALFTLGLIPWLISLVSAVTFFMMR